ncbi:hypothetical protein [Thiolapillus sp.]
MSAQLPQQAPGAGPWLHVTIDDWSFVLPKSQLQALEEAAELQNCAQETLLCQFDRNGWPVFDIDRDLNPQAPRPRRFAVFLQNLDMPVGIGADQVDILMPESIDKRLPVPGLLQEDRYLTAMLVLKDGNVAAQMDGMLLALHLAKVLPADFIAETTGAES